MKKCKKCQETKAYIEFSVRKTGKDGYYNACIKCRNLYSHKPEYKEKQNQWKKSNIERVREIKRKCKEKHKEEYNRRHREIHAPKYRANNLEKCRKACNDYKKANKERLKEYGKKYSEVNKELIQERQRLYWRKTKDCPENIKKRTQYRLKTADKIKERQKNRDKAKVLAKSHKRRAVKLQAYPSWLKEEDKVEILNKIKTLKDMNKRNDGVYHLDHIIPLNNPDVCGLHVPWNLQILTATENLHKSNKFDGTYDNESWRLTLPLFRPSQHV